MPEHVRGVINLRGKVIPVIDLRLKFGLPAVEYTERTCIIVADVDLAPASVMMGIVVDSVSEVLNVTEAEIDETRRTSADSTSDRLPARRSPRSRARSRFCSISISVLGSDGQLGTPSGRSETRSA